MLQKSVKSLLLQAKRFSALSNWNRHIIVAHKNRGQKNLSPVFMCILSKTQLPYLHCITRKTEVTAVAVTSVIG